MTVRPSLCLGVVVALALALASCSSSKPSAAPGSTAAKRSSTTTAPKAATSASVLTGATPCEKAGAPASEGQVLDGEGHFHRGPTEQDPLNRATHMQLEDQQIQARAVVAKYPTVAAAVAAGYRQSTVYVPCIGAHYTNVLLAVGFNPSAPSELLFEGTRPDSRIVGLSYLVYHPGGAPDGFAEIGRAHV